MQITIKPSPLRGSITAHTSKSAMQRACAAALLKGGATVLHHPGSSADDEAALDIIQQLGARVQYINDTVHIHSEGIQPKSDSIHCGESGLSVRMFTPIAALSSRRIRVTGAGSLTQRPLSFFNEVLPQLGVQVSSNEGRLPLEITGPLQPRAITVDGALSSQFLTGLLFAYAAADASDITINVQNLNSKPYIDLTLQVMADFGLKTPVHHEYAEFYFPRHSTAQFDHDLFQYTVEGDWSGAAFILVAGAIAGDVTVRGLNMFSTQADKAILTALQQCGASLEVEEQWIRASEGRLKAFQFDATDCPDLFPPLVALAANCEGVSEIRGVHRLTHKESNRGLTLQQEFGKLGIQIELGHDVMKVSGGRLNGGHVHSHHDHRIAMACAVGALRAGSDVTIDGAEAVNKSYPQFWNHLQHLIAYSLIKA